MRGILTDDDRPIEDLIRQELKYQGLKSPVSDADIQKLIMELKKEPHFSTIYKFRQIIGTPKRSIKDLQMYKVKNIKTGEIFGPSNLTDLAKQIGEYPSLLSANFRLQKVAKGKFIVVKDDQDFFEPTEAIYIVTDSITKKTIEFGTQVEVCRYVNCGNQFIKPAIENKELLKKRYLIEKVLRKL